MLLKGKTAVVTGGSRGIGLAIVKRFLEEGANVALCGSREETAQKALDGILAENPDAPVMAIWPNVSDEAELEAAFRQVAERFGGLDIVCNNAGISQSTPLDAYTPEEFDKIIEINVKGVLNGCQAASRVLGEGGVINMNIDAGTNADNSDRVYVTGTHTGEHLISLNNVNSASLTDGANGTVLVSVGDEQGKFSALAAEGKLYWYRYELGSKESAEQKKSKSLKDPLEDIMDTDIVVGVNKLWTNEAVPITNFAGKAELRHGIGLHRMNMVGNYGASRDVKMKLDFEPRGEEYMLTVDSNNAGSTLKVLRLYDNMKGGNLKIEAKRDKYKNFRGHARIRDFALANTPIFAKLLSVASLSGIVDVLTGEGLTFTHLNAPFSYTFSTKNLETDGARMFGSVLGVTINGRYNLADDEVEAKGMIIPAYGLNTFIGNIPLVGKMLAGKDGTVFATNYSVAGRITAPEISINPLSTLAPNSLKELFSTDD